MEMKIEQTDEYICVNGRFDVLSSAVFNGGYVRNVEKILNVRVDEDFNEDATQFFINFLKRHMRSIEYEKVVGMMTAVPMDKASVVSRKGVTAVVTAGIKSRTVNIILIIDRNMCVSAMAEAIIVATEAKSAALYDLNVRDACGDILTGDLTDAIVVACPRSSRCFGEEMSSEAVSESEAVSVGVDEGESVKPNAVRGRAERSAERFAGKATQIGRTIYEVVKEAVCDSLRKSGTVADADILKQLEMYYGIRIEDITDAAFSLYVAPASKSDSRDSASATSATSADSAASTASTASAASTASGAASNDATSSNASVSVRPAQSADGRKGEVELLRERFKHVLRRECEDLNVSALIYAAMLIDEAIRKGWFGGEPARSDASWIVADEIIGISIAEYIGGKNALFNFFRYDTKKPGILSRLPTFMDDAIGGLIAGCMSKMFAYLE